MTRFRRFALSILILAGTVWLVSAPALAQSADATKRLFDAVRANEKAKVQAAIAEGADVNVRNSLGMTPIDIAVDRGFYDLAHFLLSHRGAIAKGDATPSAPGPLAAEPVPVPSVQKTEILGAPGKPSQYVTVPSAPPQAVERPAPEPVQAPPPPPKLAPGQPNPFAPGKAVVATRAAQAPPAAPTGPAPASTGSASEGGLLDKIKGVFTASPENVAKPVEDKPATEKTEAPAAKEPEGRPAEPDSGPGIMDRLKGIFGSSPDKSSAAPPLAPEAMAAVAPVAPPTPAPTPAIAQPPPVPPAPVAPPAAAPPSMEQALAKLDRAASLLDKPTQAEPVAPSPAAAVEPPASPTAEGPNLFKKLGEFFSRQAAPDPPPASTVATDPPVPAATQVPEPPKPAAVTAWVGQNKAPFDPDKAVATAAPLPPEAVPAPPPPPAPAPLPVGAPEPAKPAASPPKATQPPLKGIPLTLGRSLILGRIKDSGDATAFCLSKKAWAGTYCVEAADWPEAVKPLFAQQTPLYSGAKAVVRYDDDRATRYHAQFPSPDMVKVVAYLEALLGPPTEVPAPKTAWLGAVREPNIRYLWVSQDGAGKPEAILDIRRYDDTSATFPSSQFGSLQLYRPEAKGIFDELQSMDLSLHAIARNRQAVQGDKPPAAAVAPPPAKPAAKPRKGQDSSGSAVKR